MCRLRKITKVALAVLWAVVFFAAAEFLLFLSGQFEPAALVEQRKWEGQTVWVDNPAYTRFVLDRHNVSVPQSVWLKSERDPATPRVVLIGESAAAGYPLTGLSLARVVDAMWSLKNPERPIEVANLTSVGINSHILRIFAREAMKLKPDVLVIYAGHNEVIGPYGPAAVFGKPLPSTWLAQLSLSVRNMRLGRAMSALLKKIPGGVPSDDSWQGLGAFREAEFSFEDPATSQVARQTAENFRAIIELARHHGVKVLVCVPAVNLTDWPPLASEENLEKSAMQAYRAAMNLQARGEQAAAWEHYRRACDLDLQRIRADSRIRQAQREVVAEIDAPDVVLVDADIWLHEQNPTFQTDRTYFLEHVHLTFEGRVAVAELIVDGLSRLLRSGQSPEVATDPETWWRSFPTRVTAAREALLYTEYDEAAMTDSIAGLFEQELFLSNPWLQKQKTDWREAARNMRAKGSRQWTPSRITNGYDTARRLLPDDDETDYTAALLFLNAGDEKAAVGALAQTLSKRPNNARARMTLARLALDRGDLAEAELHLSIQATLDPAEVGLAGLLAETLVAQQKFSEAIPYLRKNLRERPADPDAVANLGLALQMVGRNEEALANFETYLRMAGPDAKIANNCAWLTATSPKSSRANLLKAVDLARRAAASEPESHRYRGTLGIALTAAGHPEEAQRVINEALGMARAAGDNQAAKELTQALNGLKAGH
jgi:tetratricopeptide (TPR) repeat protein/lysophospholipase L1-like esterase